VCPHAATCPTAPDHASLPRWTQALPRVQWLRTPLPFLDPLWCHRVSYDSGPHLLVEEGFDTAKRPTVPNGLRVSRIKKSIVGLPTQLGLHVSNTCSQVYKAPGTRTIMTCKMCGQVVPS
jgi:hypothetical protein